MDPQLMYMPTHESKGQLQLLRTYNSKKKYEETNTLSQYINSALKVLFMVDKLSVEQTKCTHKYQCIIALNENHNPIQYKYKNYTKLVVMLNCP